VVHKISLFLQGSVLSNDRAHLKSAALTSDVSATSSYFFVLLQDLTLRWPGRGQEVHRISTSNSVDSGSIQMCFKGCFSVHSALLDEEHSLTMKSLEQQLQRLWLKAQVSSQSLQPVEGQSA